MLSVTRKLTSTRSRRYYACNVKTLRSHPGLLIVTQRSLARFSLGDDIFNVYD
jgi:hypothetical protein